MLSRRGLSSCSIRSRRIPRTPAEYQLLKRCVDDADNDARQLQIAEHAARQVRREIRNFRTREFLIEQ